MNIDTAISLMPVSTAVQPITASEHKGIRSFRYHNHRRDGIIYTGYGLNSIDGIYGPSGKRLEDRVASNKIVDIYV